MKMEEETDGENVNIGSVSLSNVSATIETTHIRKVMIDKLKCIKK